MAQKKREPEDRFRSCRQGAWDRLRGQSPEAIAMWFAVRLGPGATMLEVIVEANYVSLGKLAGIKSDAAAKRLLAGLVRDGLVAVDEAAGLVADLVGGITYPARTRYQVEGWWACWRELPESELKHQLVEVLKAGTDFTKGEASDAWDRTFGGVTTPSRKGVGTPHAQGVTTPTAEGVTTPCNGGVSTPPEGGQVPSRVRSRVGGRDSEQRTANSEKEPPSRAPARVGDYRLAQLEADWWQLVGSNPGDHVALGEVLALLERAASAKGVPLPDFARSLLPHVKAVFADMRQRGVHRGAPTAADLARKPDADPGRYLNQALALLDGQRFGAGAASASPGAGGDDGPRPGTKPDEATAFPYRMPNGKAWPRELWRCVNELPVDAATAMVAKMRRGEPFRFDADGNATF